MRKLSLENIVNCLETLHLFTLVFNKSILTSFKHLHLSALLSGSRIVKCYYSLQLANYLLLAQNDKWLRFFLFFCFVFYNHCFMFKILCEHFIKHKTALIFWQILCNIKNKSIYSAVIGVTWISITAAGDIVNYQCLQ